MSSEAESYGAARVFQDRSPAHAINLLGLGADVPEIRHAGPRCEQAQVAGAVDENQAMSLDRASLRFAPTSLQGWTDWFRDAEIPVLTETAEMIELMRANEDAVDANHLGETLARDPLMTLKVLAFAATHRHARVVTDVETVTAALVMMGIGPFFRSFPAQPTVEAHLASNPQALAGLRSVLRRAERAASFALGFAVHRMDPDAAVIHSAALLHDFAEMLLWCHAPECALKVLARQRADGSLRSHEAQRAILGVELVDLEQSLMKAWRLPELLAQMTDDRHADQPMVRTVSLAVRIARHSASGWHHAALPEDIVELAQLLNLAPASAMTLARSLDPAF